MSKVGDLIRRTRENSLDPLTGEPYTRVALGQVLGISDKTVGAIETGRILSVAPEHANAIARVLNLNVAEICKAMGFDVDVPNLSAQEADVVRILRRLPPEPRAIVVDMLRGAARGALAKGGRRVEYRVREAPPTRKVAERD